MTVLEMALRYYPKYWSDDRLVTLVKADKMSVEDYKAVTGQDYSE